MRIRALLFDLDDTLLETHDSHRAALGVSCARAAVSHPGRTVEQLREAFTCTYRELEAQLEAGTLHPPSQVSLRTQTWEETLRSCGLSPDLAEELARVYLEERRRRYRLYDDVPKALERLARDYRLVLVTNGLGDIQREKVAAVGLERWIRQLVVSAEVGSWKPDPGIFQRALEVAEVAPRDTVMVGDSLTRDVQGAGAAGIRTVWMRRYPHLEPVEGIRPDHTLTSLDPLAELLATL